MTPPNANPTQAAEPHADPLVTRRGRRFATTVGVHTVVDAFSFITVSLMPLLQTQLELADRQVALLLAVGSIASGLVQPLVAYVSDRWNTRLFGTLGLVVACLAISCVGLVNTFEQLLVIQVLGTMGVGAFHPPAAAAAGQLAGARRSLGVAIFFMSGMLGGVLGNVLSPVYVREVTHAVAAASIIAETEAAKPDYRIGLKALVLFIIPGLIAAYCLARAIHRVPHRTSSARDTHRALPPKERAVRWRTVAMLYLGNIIWFTTNMSLVYLVFQWVKRFVAYDDGVPVGTPEPIGQLTEQAAAQAALLNGPMQASMQVGMGGAGLLAGWLLRAHHEKPAIVLAPLLGAAAIATFPHADAWRETITPAGALAIAFTLSVIAGMGFGGMVPVTISLAQRLIPHRTSMASGLMLGGAWAFAFIGPITTEHIHRTSGLNHASYAAAALLAASGILALGLPTKLIHQVSAR